MTTLTTAAVLGLLLAGTDEPAPLHPSRKVEQKKETARDGRIGFVRRMHRFGLGNGTTLSHEAYLDPKTGKAFQKKWNDAVFRYNGRGGMGWSPWYWLHIFAADLKGAAASVVYNQRLYAAHFLPGADRTVAEFVWEMPRPDKQGQPTDAVDHVAARFVAQRGDPRVWVDVWVGGAPSPRPVRLQFRCYPSSTKKVGWQQRERWGATPGAEFNLHKVGRQKLRPKDDWAVVFFNRQAQTRATCQFVFLPEEIAAVSTAGTYGIDTVLTPVKGARRMRFVFDQQHGTAAEVERERFLKAAPKWRDELRAFDWGVTPAAKARYREQRKFLDELLGGAKTRAKYGKQVAKLYAEFERLIAQPAAKAATLDARLAGWRAVGALDRLDELKRPMTVHHITHDLLGD